MPKLKPNWQAVDLVRLLREKYAAPEFAFIEEARAGTGWKANRSADGLALSLWPSRGIYFSGFEVKVRRGDWRRELSNPAKAEEISAFCKYWWIVAPPDVIDPADMPETWGLMIPDGKKLKTIIKAPPLKPKPITIDVIAALLRRVTDQHTPIREVDHTIGAEVTRRTKVFKETYERTVKDLHNRITTFEKSSGVKIDQWDGEQIGQAVRYVREHGVAGVASDLERMARSAEMIAERARAEADKVRAESVGVAS